MLLSRRRPRRGLNNSYNVLGTDRKKTTAKYLDFYDFFVDNSKTLFPQCGFLDVTLAV